MEYRLGLDHGRRFHYCAHGQGGRCKVRRREEGHYRLRDDELTPCDARQPCRKTRGSRNRLNGGGVICALLRDFRKHGERPSRRCVGSSRGVYLKVIAMVLPREQSSGLYHLNDIATLKRNMGLEVERQRRPEKA